MRDFLDRFIHHFPKVLVLEIIGAVVFVIVYAYSTWLHFPPSDERDRGGATTSVTPGEKDSSRVGAPHRGAQARLDVCPGTDFPGCNCHRSGCILAPTSTWIVKPKSVELRERAAAVTVRLRSESGEERSASTSGSGGTELVFSSDAGTGLRFRASAFKAGLELFVRFDGKGAETKVTVQQTKSIKPGAVFEEGLALHSADPTSRLKSLVVYLEPDVDAAADGGRADPADEASGSGADGDSAATAAALPFTIVDLTPSAWPGGMYLSPALGRIAILYFVVVLFLGMWVAAEDIRKRSLVESLRRVFTIVLGLLFHAGVAPLAAGALFSLLWTLVSYAFWGQPSALKLSFVWFCAFSLLTFFVAILFVRDVKKVRKSAPTDLWGRIARRGAVVFTIVGNIFLVKDVVKLLWESARSLP